MKSRITLALALCAGTALFTALPARANNDGAIESAIKNSYVFKTYLKDDAIKAEAWHGTVTLTGTVAQPSHRALAQDTVAALPGVTKVVNQLATKGITPTENSDGWIGMKVKSALLFHRNVSAAATDVSVNQGVVTLRGDATSDAQKELTGELAGGVIGVKSLKNEMTVATKSATTDQSFTWAVIDDASITAQVKATLLEHRSTSALSTKVSTQAGVVTVSGPAKNEAEVSLVSKLIGDIPGVNSVVNHMVAAPTASNN